jgi:arsenite oxidase small subunit
MPLTRRKFVQSSAMVAVLAPLKPTLYFASNLPFRAVKIANLSALKTGVPITFQYPNAQSPANLVKLGRPALGGVGPAQDIVAFSATCTHMGCNVLFKGDRFECPCHYSQFDPAKNGEVFQGMAVEYLPQIQLHVTASGDILAEAIEGVTWGHTSDAR